ncbi:hypothetical protein [Alkalihalobacillus trypoxylicola]|uniref:Uncharacterized protein n=1 Tax=Alkalihalobacillus trypoxylicola TaxID=519424 RepID=A0A161QKA0_9BACI|nr:hypothetical protein [Alkalihalobacillus trypoxylicola]KYG30042.1 hypothetical protein AZF04_20065 [Alkalihalobacillus trypoxylicola]
MKQYRFSNDMNQKIVDGILQGYKNYVDEREEKRKSMKISSAYAWVKGNHIDDQTASLCKEIGVEYKNATAGYTWGYLQLVSKDTRKMFILKNARYFNKDNFPGGTGVNGKKNKEKKKDNYLKNLSKINQDVDFPKEKNLLTDDNPTFLRLFDDNTLKSLEKSDVNKLQKDFDNFYIVTYGLDEGNMISNIKVWMPNPNNDVAYEVDDLTSLISTSSIDITDIDTSVLENDLMDDDYTYNTAFDYDIELDELDDDKKDESGK